MPIDPNLIEGQAKQLLAFFPNEEMIMTRAITLKGVVSVLACVVIDHVLSWGLLSGSSGGFLGD